MKQPCDTCSLEDVQAKPGLRNIAGIRPIPDVSGTSCIAYRCLDCGRTWSVKDKYLWWPVHFHWQPRKLWRYSKPFDLGWHGVQVGCYDISAKLFMRVIRIGPLRILLGKRKELQATEG